MTQEDILRMMQQQTGKRDDIQIPTDKLDEFIDRCIKEKDYTLHSLAQDINFQLTQAPLVSYPELEILPLCLQRIKERLVGGEK